MPCPFCLVYLQVWICSHRSALNMSYQNLTPVRGKPNCVAELKGADLMGVAGALEC